MKATLTQEEVAERIEHRDVLLNIRAVLATASGKEFVKYLFKHFGVGELPEIGLDGSLLMDKIGFLRAGTAIFDLVAEAEPDQAANLLAQNVKERNAKIYAENEQG